MGLEFDFSMLDAMDILDLAVFVELEAQENYEQLADWAAEANPEAAEFFRRMAGWEALHGSQIRERRQALFGDTPAKYTSNIAWEVETPDYDEVGSDLTARQAMQLAYDAEERAGAYYNGVLEYVSDEQTVSLLEMLRDSEVEHKRLVMEQMEKLDD